MRPLFYSEIKVQRLDWVLYDYRHGEGRGSGSCRDQGVKQRLVRIYRLLGVKVWTSILDEEDVPLFAVIQVATLGSTEWRSKFREYIK